MLENYKKKSIEEWLQDEERYDTAWKKLMNEKHKIRIADVKDENMKKRLIEIDDEVRELREANLRANQW